MSLSVKQVRDVALFLEDAEHAAMETHQKINMLVRYLAGHDEEIEATLARALTEAHTLSQATLETISGPLQEAWQLYDEEKRDGSG